MPADQGHLSGAESSCISVEVEQIEEDGAEVAGKRSDEPKAKPCYFSSINGSSSDTASNSSTVVKGESLGFSADSAPAQCVLERKKKAVVVTNPSVLTGEEGGAGFFSSKWRQQLCRCTECMVSVPRGGVEFIWVEEGGRGIDQ